MFRAIRFRGSETFQLADIKLNSGSINSLGVAQYKACSDFDESCPVDEAGGNALDGDVNTKWLVHDPVKPSIFIEFSEEEQLTSVQLCFANDYPERDPVNFAIYVAADDSGMENPDADVWQLTLMLGPDLPDVGRLSCGETFQFGSGPRAFLKTTNSFLLDLHGNRSRP